MDCTDHVTAVWRILETVFSQTQKSPSSRLLIFFFKCRSVFFVHNKPNITNMLISFQVFASSNQSDAWNKCKSKSINQMSLSQAHSQWNLSAGGHYSNSSTLPLHCNNCHSGSLAWGQNSSLHLPPKPWNRNCCNSWHVRTIVHDSSTPRCGEPAVMRTRPGFVFKDVLIKTFDSG